MGVLPIHLPAAHTPRLPVPHVLPSAEEMRSWALTLGLGVLVGMIWMNASWLNTLFELVLFLVAGVLAFTAPQTAKPSRAAPLLLAAAIPAWGALGLALGHVAYNYAALLGVLYWTTIPACLLLSTLLLRERKVRDAFLKSLWFLAAAVTALELYQILILGRYTVMSSGYPLMSSNLYAELAELLLPAVLATALRQGGRLWTGAMLCALMLGTTVSAGARMGTVLLMLEVVAVLLATRKAQGYRMLTWRKHGLALGAILLAALTLEGTTFLTGRVTETDLLEGRSEIISSSLTMAQQRLATGLGLGAFPVVYPQFARLVTTSFVNHAHNDYLELAAEGGLPALILWLALIAICLRSVFRSPWAFGTCAILIHGVTDFPLYRLPVLALLSLLLGAALIRWDQFKQASNLQANHRKTTSAPNTEHLSSIPSNATFNRKRLPIIIT